MDENPAAAKVARKRKAILEASLKVFARQGFRQTDVQLIADECGIGKGTVYRHFGSKEDLFLATARASVEWLGEYVASQLVPSGDTGDLFRQIAIAVARFFQKRPEALEIMIQERAEFREWVFPTFLSYRSDKAPDLDQLIAEAVSRGEFRAVDASAVSTAFIDLVYGTVVCGCLGGGRKVLVQRAEQAVDLFLMGLLSEDNPIRGSSDASVSTVALSSRRGGSPNLTQK